MRCRFAPSAVPANSVKRPCLGLAPSLEHRGEPDSLRRRDRHHRPPRETRMNDAATDTRIIDGKAYAVGVRAKVAAQVDALREPPRHRAGTGGGAGRRESGQRGSTCETRRGRPARRACSRSSTGVPVTTSQDDLLALVRRLNEDPRVSGILVQLPLPDQISADAVIATIDPAKDVDGFHTTNAGRARGRRRRHGAVHAARLPDAAQGTASAICRERGRSCSAVRTSSASRWPSC